MLLSYLWTTITAISFLFAVFLETGAKTAAAAMEGAKAGVELALSMSGALCLWTGLSAVMERSGVHAFLARLFRPLLGRIFPEAGTDDVAFGHLVGNFTANLLGLGNAATPMGIAAVTRMKERSGSAVATDEMCRLIVLNSASIQLIPSTVAAARAALGAAAPFDILPAVWVSSLVSAAAGVFAAWVMGKRYV